MPATILGDANSQFILSPQAQAHKQRRTSCSNQSKQKRQLQDHQPHILTSRGFCKQPKAHANNNTAEDHHSTSSPTSNQSPPLPNSPPPDQNPRLQLATRHSQLPKAARTPQFALQSRLHSTSSIPTTPTTPNQTPPTSRIPSSQNQKPKHTQRKHTKQHGKLSRNEKKRED